MRIGVPSKGRLSELAGELLKEAGLNYRRPDRSLFARCRDVPIDVTFLRTEDIPVLCAEGAIDMGLTGSDLVAEHRRRHHRTLAAGRRTLPAGDLRTREWRRRRAAQTWPGVASPPAFPTPPRISRKASHDGAMVPLSGSVEVMIALGVADAIVDLVETGSTLAANGLKILDEIGHYQTVLIQNRARRHPELADRVVRRLEGVVIARSYSLLEYNVPRGKLADAEKITPGFNSPTVSAWKMPIGARCG